MMKGRQLTLRPPLQQRLMWRLCCRCRCGADADEVGLIVCGTGGDSGLLNAAVEGCLGAGRVSAPWLTAPASPTLRHWVSALQPTAQVSMPTNQHAHSLFHPSVQGPTTNWHTLSPLVSPLSPRRKSAWQGTAAPMAVLAIDCIPPCEACNRTVHAYQLQLDPNQ